MSATRLGVALVGQSVPQLIKVNLDSDPEAVRAELIATAAAKLGVAVGDHGAVCMHLGNGAPIDDVNR